MTLLEERDARGRLCRCGCGNETRLAPRTKTYMGWVKGEPVRFIHGHNPGISPWTRETALEAVRAFAERNGYQPVTREAGAYHGLPTQGVTRHLFGSWNEMIRAAGFDPYPPQNSTLAKRLARRDRNRERCATSSCWAFGKTWAVHARHPLTGAWIRVVGIATEGEALQAERDLVETLNAEAERAAAGASLGITMGKTRF